MGRQAGRKDFLGHKAEQTPVAHTLLLQPIWVGRYVGGTIVMEEAGVCCQNVQGQDGTSVTDPVPVPFSLSHRSPGSQLSLLPSPQTTGSEVLSTWFLWKGTPLIQPRTVSFPAGAVSGEGILGYSVMETRQATWLF